MARAGGRQPRALDRRPDEQEQPVATDGGQVLELVAQGELRLVVGAVDDRDVAGPGVAVADELLEDRADRGDADAGGEEQDATADALAGGEGAVGALEEDAGAGTQVGQAARVVAELADRDPQMTPVGGARDRPRVGGREQAGADEAPVEVLAGADREAVEVTPLHPDRPHAGGLLDDLGDAQAVTEAPGDRDEQSPPHDAGRDEDEEGPPVGPNPLRR